MATPDYSALTTPLLQNWTNNNNLQQNLYGQASQSLATPFSFGSLPAMPTTADQTGRDQMTNAVYDQQTRYLDPQFQQGQSDLDSKLTNQGIMQGSDAWNRAQNNFSLQKTAAYGDARDRAIQQGGAEQTRLFNLGLQARNQGINEGIAQRDMPLQEIQALNGIGNAYSGNLFNATNNSYNAQAYQNAGLTSGLFSLGSAAIQNPTAIQNVWNWASNLWS